MNEQMTEQIAREVLRRMETQRPNALLIGDMPQTDLGFRYDHGSYSAVVIGSISMAKLLYFSYDKVYTALAEGKSVYLYEGGLPHRKTPVQNRLLHSRLLAAERNLKQLGIQFVGAAAQGKLISAAEARRLRASGLPLPPGCRLTPLAREILEGET